MLASCAGRNTDNEYVPQDGDIAFQVSETSDFVKAITDVSAMHDSIKFSHVGIVVIDKDGPAVLEAVPQGGVKITPMDTYLADAETLDGRPGVVIKRINHDFPIDKAIAKAKTYIGQEYDWNFLPDNGKMYCSELVYEGFIDEDGTHLFKSSPMNFRNSDGEYPAYWVDLFTRLGAEIPQDVQGTSPQEMSQDSSLVEVYRYF